MMSWSIKLFLQTRNSAVIIEANNIDPQNVDTLDLKKLPTNCRFFAMVL